MDGLTTTVCDVAARRRAKVDGSSVSAVRTAKDLTQRDLADLLRVTSTTVSRWERGQVDFAVWLGVLHAVGLPADWQPETPTPNT